MNDSDQLPNATLPAEAPKPHSLLHRILTRHAVLLVLPGTIWGASFLFIAEGLRSIAPNGLTFTRILIGFAALSMVPRTRRPIPLSAWPRVALLGLLWFAFPLSMFPHAEQHVSSALTGMLNGAVPLFATTVAAVLARRLPSSGVLIGLVIGMGGGVLMTLPTWGAETSEVTGVLLILAALVSYGFALNVAGPLQQEFGALPVIWRAQMVALVLTAPLGFPELMEAHWILSSGLSLLALGALGTGLAFVVQATAAGRVGAARASATTYLIPTVALLLGVAVLGEHVSLISILGAAICVTGAWVMQVKKRAATRQAAS